LLANIQSDQQKHTFPIMFSSQHLQETEDELQMPSLSGLLNPFKTSFVLSLTILTVTVGCTTD